MQPCKKTTPDIVTATHVPSRRIRGRVFFIGLGVVVGCDSADVEPVPREVVAVAAVVMVVARWGVRVEESTRVVLQYSLD